jgi:hypothetical protein
LSRATWVWALCALVAAACGRSGRSCHFGPEHPIFESHRGTFDDVVLVATRAGPLAVFSDAAGLYTRALDAHGLPRARWQRIADGCNGGVTAAVSGEQVLVACSRPAADGGEPGAVTLYVFDGGWQERARLEPVGPNSHGVALAPRAGGAALAWSDAAMGGGRVWYAAGEHEPARQLSESEWYGSSPGLVQVGSRLLAVWAESHELDRAYESRVRMADLSAAGALHATTVATGRDAAPSPGLVGTDAELWLAFRDHRKAARKTGLYVSRLARDGRRMGPAVRVGRADGVGRPILQRCLGGLIAATPRTFAGDYFVGVVHIDSALEHLSSEQQFYEDSHEFAQVAASCLGSEMLLLIAERGRLGVGRATLHSVTFTCE